MQCFESRLLRRNSDHTRIESVMAEDQAEETTTSPYIMGDFPRPLQQQSASTSGSNTPGDLKIFLRSSFVMT